MHKLIWAFNFWAYAIRALFSHYASSITFFLYIISEPGEVPGRIENCLDVTLLQCLSSALYMHSRIFTCYIYVGEFS